jgi:serine/threonine-protein kinase
MVGQQIGSYKISQQIGEGALGKLFVGEHVQQRFRATVRQIRAEYNEESALRRYAQMASTAAQSPGVQGFAEVFTHGMRNSFFAYELLQGESLASRLARDRKLPPDLAVSLTWQIAMILHPIHAAGLVHGLLRPSTIFLVPDQQMMGGLRVKIQEFGLVSFTRGAPNWGQPYSSQIFQTALYLSPEQIKGESFDHRADVYSLGALFHQMMTGRAPYLGQNPSEIANAVLQMPQRPASEFDPTVPQPVDQLLWNMLQKDPNQRMQTMQQVSAALDDIASRLYHGGQPAAMKTLAVQLGAGAIGGPPPAARRRGGRLAIVLAIVVVLGGGGAAAFFIGQKKGWFGKKASAASVAPDAAPAPAPDAGPPPLSEADQKLLDAQKLVDAEKFTEALTAAKAVEALDADKAKAFEAKVKTEQAAKKPYDDFTEAVKEKSDIDRLLRKFGAIPDKTSYRTKAQPIMDKAKTDWIAAQLTEAEGAAKRKSCDHVTSILTGVASRFPDAVDPFMAAQKTCLTGK